MLSYNLIYTIFGLIISFIIFAYLYIFLFVCAKIFCGSENRQDIERIPHERRQERIPPGRRISGRRMRNTELPPGLPFNVITTDLTECPICLDDFTDTIICFMPRCRHIFHKICAHQWLQTSGTCPVCRRPARAPQIHNI